MKSFAFVSGLLAIHGNAILWSADPGGSAPATITKEGDLIVLTLTPDAEQALRLKTVVVERKPLAAVRLFSGEVVRPLAAEGKQAAPVIGGTLDEFLRLADLQATADGRIREAQVQIDAAKIALDRARKMLDAEAGSARGVDDAKTSLALAEAAMSTARAQRNLLGEPIEDVGGAKRFWVRVSVYSGESALLDAEAESVVSLLGGTLLTQSASPVSGPSTANALNNTLDWYYSLPADAKCRAGERVAVEIPTRDSKVESLVVPFHSVLHDIHGGQWVYEQSGEHRYTRRRIQVARLAGNEAVLASGPPAGTRIVTDGSAELFGTEFMTGK